MVVGPDLTDHDGAVFGTSSEGGPIGMFACSDPLRLVEPRRQGAQEVQSRQLLESIVDTFGQSLGSYAVTCSPERGRSDNGHLDNCIGLRNSHEHAR